MYAAVLAVGYPRISNHPEFLLKTSSSPRRSRRRSFRIVNTERCSWWSDETVVACSRFAYLNFGISAFFGNRRNSPSENCRHPVARVGPNVAIFFGHQLSEWIDQPLRDWPRSDI
jgi:hypothetical protein